MQAPKRPGKPCAASEGRPEHPGKPPGALVPARRVCLPEACRESSVGGTGAGEEVWPQGPGSVVRMRSGAWGFHGTTLSSRI